MFFALMVGALFAVLAGGFVAAVASTPDPARIDPHEWLRSDPDTCDHVWRYHDQRDIFVCSKCGRIEEAD